MLMNRQNMNEGILENNTTAENDETEAMNINSAIESANNAEKGANMETGTGRIKDAASWHLVMGQRTGRQGRTVMSIRHKSLGIRKRHQVLLRED